MAKKAAQTATNRSYFNVPYKTVRVRGLGEGDTLTGKTFLSVSTRMAASENGWASIALPLYSIGPAKKFEDGKATDEFRANVGSVRLTSDKVYKVSIQKNGEFEDVEMTGAEISAAIKETKKAEYEQLQAAK